MEIINTLFVGPVLPATLFLGLLLLWNLLAVLGAVDMHMPVPTYLQTFTCPPMVTCRLAAAHNPPGRRQRLAGVPAMD